MSSGFVRDIVASLEDHSKITVCEAFVFPGSARSDIVFTTTSSPDWWRHVSRTSVSWITCRTNMTEHEAHRVIESIRIQNV